MGGGPTSGKDGTGAECGGSSMIDPKDSQDEMLSRRLD